VVVGPTGSGLESLGLTLLCMVSCTLPSFLLCCPHSCEGMPTLFSIPLYMPPGSWCTYWPLSGLSRLLWLHSSNSQSSPSCHDVFVVPGELGLHDVLAMLYACLTPSWVVYDVKAMTPAPAVSLPCYGCLKSSGLIIFILPCHRGIRGSGCIHISSRSGGGSGIGLSISM
jgi:hypothetical protein